MRRTSSVNLRLTPHDHARVTTLAARDDVAVSVILRRAIRLLLDQEEQAARPHTHTSSPAASEPTPDRQPDRGRGEKPAHTAGGR